MLNPKTHHPPAPCQQLDVDICLALVGQPIGRTKVQDLPAAPPVVDADKPTQIDLTHLLVIPTNKTAVKAWVKTVQSRVVQVSETMKTRMAEAGDQMRSRVMESAGQAAKRMRDTQVSDRNRAA